jgi:hypothetical protein
MAEKMITDAILGKDIDSMTYADVEKYFAMDRSENIRLEFKAYVDAKLKGPASHLAGVYESISGMLNSEGGLIIWGAPEGVPVAGSKEKTFKGSLTLVEHNLDEDQMNNAILDNLSPMPPKVRFRKLTEGKGRIYLFEVPRSPYAPHQYKGTYYARFNASTRKAPHYLVEALMRRVKFPNIGVTLELQRINTDKKNYVALELMATCRNYSRLQNERDLVLTAHTSKGSFDPNQFHFALEAEPNHDRSLVIIHKAGAQLHYGVTRSHRFHLKIPMAQYIKDEIIYMQVAVAGRNSPMKYSIYAIRASLNEPDMPKLIRTIKENSLAIQDDPTLGE